MTQYIQFNNPKAIIPLDSSETTEMILLLLFRQNEINLFLFAIVFVIVSPTNDVTIHANVRHYCMMMDIARSRWEWLGRQQKNTLQKGCALSLSLFVFQHNDKFLIHQTIHPSLRLK